MSSSQVVRDNPPALIELLKHRLAMAGKRDKIVNIKIAINTARMIADRDVSAELIEAAKTFVLRVEAGEVRSKKTYAQFKRLLKINETGDWSGEES